MSSNRFLAILLIFTAFSAKAQKRITNQQLLWYAYNNILEFNKKWFLYTEIQERHFINPVKQHQNIYRSHIHYRITDHVDVAAGMCTFLQSPNDPHSTSNLVVPELRPHLEVSYKQHEGKLAIEQRLRFEWRYFHNTAGNELAEGYTFGNNRARYQLTFLYPVWKMKENRPVKIKIGNELHVNIGKKIIYNFIDHNRFFASLNFQITDGISLEPGYVNWFQQRTSGIDYYNRNIFRVSVYHRINLGSK